jgi:ABC-type transporter Mla subunit MlaD
VGALRILLFWAITGVVFWGIGHVVPLLAWDGLKEQFAHVSMSLIGGDVAVVAEAFGQPGFSAALASAIAAFAIGLLAAYGLTHVLYVWVSMFRANRAVSRFSDRRAFAAAYEDEVLGRLVQHPLIGTAWKEFDETLLKHEVPEQGIIRNTIRPQSFVNYALIREKLIGLKMLNQIGGYFVALGLLLTFIGIVLALRTAGPAVNSGSAEEMKGAMAHLLDIASFKFSTSIAGLAASLLFALLARIYTIIIEDGLARFCDAAEHQMLYTPPQSITFAMHEVAMEQRDQLKEINSDRYFTRIAEHMSPLLEQALSKAVTPVIGEIGKQVSSSVQGSAGVEMARLGETLAQMQSTLESTKTGLQGTGEEFARRMTEAADNLNKVVANAGRNLERSAEQSRSGLADIMTALREAFNAASTRVNDELGSAAQGATDRLETVMGRVLKRLEEQVVGFTGSVSKVQEQTATSVVELERQMRAAQEQASAVISATAGEVAKAMETGLAEAIEKIRVEVNRIETSMRAGQAAYERQAGAISEVAGQTKGLADAFARTAQEVRSAANPLAQTSSELATVTRQITETNERTAARFGEAAGAAKELAGSLSEQIQALNVLWAGYKGQFDKVDQDLAKAIQSLASATDTQSDRLHKFVGTVDKDLSGCLDKLSPLLQSLEQNSQELSDSVETLARTLTRN